MGKHRSSFHKSQLPHLASAEAKKFLQAGIDRLHLLLKLCDREIVDFHNRLADKYSNNPKFKEIEKVANTVLRLQKMLDHYTTLLHSQTPQEQVSPIVAEEIGAEKQPAEQASSISHGQSSAITQEQQSTKKFSQEFFKRPVASSL
jgi:cell shape-determining protein MreC